MDNSKLKQLKITSAKVRRHIIDAVYNASSGHPGGSLGIADILTVLYNEVLNIDPSNPKMENRDRFVLSKGHCSPALYGILAEKGYFPKKEILKFRKIDSYLQGHPDSKKVPGVDASTGSLGHGISVACGMAISAKLDKKDFRVYTVLGDGELEEGQVWEAAMFAAHYKLDNLTAFVDFNGLQIDGDITKVMSPLPIDEKFKAFGWNVLYIDAHNYEQIISAIEEAKLFKGKPTMILATSIKGKGVSFMEGQASWHGSAPNKEQYEQAVAELDELLKQAEED
ncbi:MAG TPA: transketolase [Clostridia bacterium]|nr:transketolase [Clostridia bacterium]